jgi:hypothetical protein
MEPSAWCVVRSAIGVYFEDVAAHTCDHRNNPTILRLPEQVA